MKILYILSSGWGGGNIAAVNLMKKMAEMNECAVLVPLGNEWINQSLSPLGVKVFYDDYGLTVWPGNRNPIKYFRNLFRLLKQRKNAKKRITKLLDSFNPDLVHTNVGPLDLAFDLCKKRKIPHVWHLREYQDLDFGMKVFPSKKNFQRKILSAGNYNVAITKGIFDYWNLRLCDKVIYDGVFQELPIQEPCKEKENTFLYAGRLEKAKGLDVLINSFARVHQKHPDWKLKVLGSIEKANHYAQHCINLVKQLGLENDIIFCGYRKDVLSFMETSKIVVVPSLHEGFGFVSVEAMKSSCLVIGRNTAGLKEQFDRGFEICKAEIALRFNTDDELHEKMIYSIENNCSEIVQRARQLVYAEYTNEKHYVQVQNMYHSVLKENTAFEQEGA